MYRHAIDRLHVQLVGTAAAAQFFEPMFFGREKEVMHAAFLDRELRVQSIYSFAGSAEEVEMSMTEVTREAVLQEAHAILICHNHPSGEYMPSRQDQIHTRDLATTCERLGITFIDHLIFAEKGYYSFRERGILPDR